MKLFTIITASLIATAAMLGGAQAYQKCCDRGLGGCKWYDSEDCVGYTKCAAGSCPSAASREEKKQ